MPKPNGKKKPAPSSRAVHREFRQASATMPAVSFADFKKLEIRSGTIVHADVVDGAERPTLHLRVDFGQVLGTLTSMAQLMGSHPPKSLIGRKVLAIVNFPPKAVAGIESEAFLLSSVSDDQSLLIAPDENAKNGSRVC